MRKSPLIQRILLGILLSLTVALLIVFLSLGSIVEKSIKYNTQKTLGVYTSVEGLRVQRFKGLIEIENLIVNNPPDFVTPYFIKASHLSLRIKPLSFLGKVAVFEKFEIERVEINVEQRAFKNNILAILDNSEDYRERRGQIVKNGFNRKFRLDRARVDEMEVELKLLPTRINNGLTFELPTFQEVEIEDITPYNIKGVVLSDLIDRLNSRLLTGVLDAIPQELSERLDISKFLDQADLN
ncbi:hypothetical protein IQ249_09695 [Lusitaniella coriacea LEGE 07157]|uniref:AsmA domain-containing protein n=1 Tax=Lusitaniella coriacea LEGE 07157 TaxID=945747 RepID=A0A8J7DW17_9CYAN|nr:hypothetical protein [Lusitaniella coriacea]MBE9116167.1 hypothetical protein [Lusitaniella coriacea LEGE 07157]